MNREEMERHVQVMNARTLSAAVAAVLETVAGFNLHVQVQVLDAARALLYALPEVGQSDPPKKK